MHSPDRGESPTHVYSFHMPAKKTVVRSVKKNLSSVNTIALCPAQEAALNGVRSALKVGCIAELHGKTCSGKTLVLQKLSREIGGVMLREADLLRVARKSHPHGIDDAVVEFIV